jgi:hypothetical protein
MGLSWQFMDPPVAVARRWLVSSDGFLHTISTASPHFLHVPTTALSYSIAVAAVKVMAEFALAVILAGFQGRRGLGAGAGGHAGRLR